MIDPLLLLVIEAVLVGGIMLALFRARRRFGPALFYAFVGALQPMRAVLTSSLYIELPLGLQVSPGSAVLFAATMFAILIAYVREDALEARRVIYAMVVVNVVCSVLSALFGLHVGSPETRNILDLPQGLFVTNPRALVVGLTVLYVDSLLIVLIYEAIGRYRPRAIFLNTLLTLLAVFVVDTVLFITGTFPGHPYYWQMIVSGIAGKAGAAVVFASLFALYSRRLALPEISIPGLSPRVRDLFQVLTYRQRYELLLAQLSRDPLTGVFNRAFFDERLPDSIETQRGQGRPLSLLMIDLDHFKRINDSFGHPCGDRILRQFASALANSLRDEDMVCRYGGEEFGVLMPGVDNDGATRVADSIRQSVASSSTRQHWLPDERAVTFAAGVATFPDDADDANTLVNTADSRLYSAKSAGRNRVVCSE